MIRATKFIRLLFSMGLVLLMGNVLIAQTNDLFSDPIVSNGKNFEFGIAALGEEMYIDRTHSFTFVPEGFINATVIKGSNDDKNVTDETDYVKFAVKRDMTLYLVYSDNGLATLPAWLTEWRQTDTTLTTSDRGFTLFAKEFASGDTVNIGGPRAAPQASGPNGIFFLADDGTTTPPAVALGDSYNFFVEAVNVNVPEIVSVDAVTDPTDDANTVARFNSGSFNAIEGFSFPDGVDMSANRMEGDSLFLRVWSSPDNINANALPRIIFLDRNPAIDNYSFRLYYNIPAEFHDGQWHDLALKLPPATRAELAEDDNWEYPGSFGGSHSIGSEEDEGWREFNWNRVVRLGVFWDQANGNVSGDVYLDNVFIGNSGDLNDTPPSAISGINVSSSNSMNTVSWSAVESASAYNVYYSGEEITNLEDSTVFFWKTVDGETFNAEHPIVSPHPNDPNHEYFYAVTATNEVGVENTSASSESVMASGDQGAYIYELTSEETSAMITALENEEFVDLFPTDKSAPFIINKDNSAHPNKPESDEEFSASIKVAYGEDQGDVFFFVNIDVNDSELLFNPVLDYGAENERLDWNSYKRDQVEIRMGGYETDFVTGTTHRSASDSTEPDYQLNFRPIAIKDTPLDSVVGVWISYSGNEKYHEQMAFAPLFEYKRDEAENIIGYKGFFAISNTELQAPSYNDEVAEFDEPLFTPPTGTEFGYFPFTPSAVDDRNDGRSRSWENSAHQIFYSYKPNFGGNYFADPSDLGTVAFAGSEVVITSNEELGRNTPNEYRLDQNYPNPFNPTTKIQFSLPNTARVKLTVFNILGQKVAQLIDGEQFTSGNHTVNFDASRLGSGMYIYKIEAGNFVSTKKMMLIK